MLGKVMKYELRAGARLLLPFFGVSVATAAVLRLMLVIAPYIWEPAGNLLTGLAASLGVLLLLAVVLLTFVAMLVRFYQSMVKNEAYLTFTLPVKTGTNIMARLLVSTIYSLASCVVAFVCGIIFIPNFLQGLHAAFFRISFSYGGGGEVTFAMFPFDIKASIIGLLLLFLVVTIVTNLVKFYVSMAIGTQFNSKLLGSVIAYFGLNAVETILMLPLILVPIAGILGQNSFALSQYLNGLIANDFFTTMRNMLGVVWVVAGIILLVSVLFGLLHYFLTRYLFKKRINLE